MHAPQAFYFGAADAPLFGWLHAAPHAAVARAGLVICNPFGYEEVCVHRSVLEIAKAAAHSGVPTLRFDYAGCGDSSGDEHDPGTLERWLQSVQQAVDTLKQASGVPVVYLLGIRLGATLAALAATRRTDIAGMIAIAPVVQGRLYVRELKVLGNSSFPGAQLGSMGDGFIEAAGFVLSDETSQAIAAVDLRALAQKPADQLLVVERDDMPAAPAWAQAMERLGVQVQCASWPGYQAMMDDPIRAEVPAAMVRGVVDTVRKWQDQLQGPSESTQVRCLPNAATRHVSCVQVAPGIAETVVQLDAGSTSLFGILTTPAPGNLPAGQGKPMGVLMLNAGAVHHIGQNRMWVGLARKWAARGVSVLRIDLSGIGDSQARQGEGENVVYSGTALRDLALAVDFMRAQMGDGDCHLVGLCSGAYHAFKLAASGQPLASVVMINPLTFYWKGVMPLAVGIKSHQVIGSTEAYKSKLFTLEPWKKLLFFKMDFRYVFMSLVLRLWAAIQPYVAAVARGLKCPLHEDLVAEMQAIARAGTLQRFVFARGDPGDALLRTLSGAMLKTFVAKGQLTIDYIDRADHTFTTVDARRRLVQVLESRLFA